MYSVRDKVLLQGANKKDIKDTLPRSFYHKRVSENGTVLMIIKNVDNTINIRRLTPYHDTDNIVHGGECSMQTSRVRRTDQD
jgi:hypothetical protein